MFSYNIQTPAGTVPNVSEVGLYDTVKAWFNENKDSCMVHYNPVSRVYHQYAGPTPPWTGDAMHDRLRQDVISRIEHLTNYMRKYGQ